MTSSQKAKKQKSLFSFPIAGIFAQNVPPTSSGRAEVELEDEVPSGLPRSPEFEVEGHLMDARAQGE